MSDQTKSPTKLAAVAPGVWALGFVSMFMDISSEMIHALLPLYLEVGLGASALTVGIIEGIAEATALITKVFSGPSAIGSASANCWRRSATDSRR